MPGRAAPTSVASRSARPATTAAGSAPACVSPLSLFLPRPPRQLLMLLYTQHGSHYDVDMDFLALVSSTKTYPRRRPQISGRARRGPAPLNLEVPEYAFDAADENKLVRTVPRLLGPPSLRTDPPFLPQVIGAPLLRPAASLCASLTLPFPLLRTQVEHPSSIDCSRRGRSGGGSVDFPLSPSLSSLSLSLLRTCAAKRRNEEPRGGFSCSMDALTREEGRSESEARRRGASERSGSRCCFAVAAPLGDAADAADARTRARRALCRSAGVSKSESCAPSRRLGGSPAPPSSSSSFSRHPLSLLPSVALASLPRVLSTRQQARPASAWPRETRARTLRACG